MPSPNKGEEKQNFIERCMSSAEAKSDFPDNDQRVAFCISQWERRNKVKDTFLYDAVEVTKPHLTKDGYLVAEAHVARTGIQVYLAKELGLDGDPDRQIRVYRPEDEVFAADAMRSYAYRPVTVDHPPTMVDATNWKEFSRGQTGPDVMRDGDMVRVPLVLMDQSAINEWANGKRELSMGYEMTLELTDGVTPSGEHYDAVQRKLRMNHLALVPRARGGSQLKLGDVQPEDFSMELKTITVDGLSVQTTEAGAQAISKLQKDVADAKQSLTDAQAKYKADLDAKDKDLATKDAEIDNLKAKVLDEAALDRQVRERADLIAKAKTVADKDYTGKTVAEIRKEAVAAKKGSAAVDGKSDAYIEASFDLLVEDAAQDPVRKTLRNGTQPNKSGDAVVDAHTGMVNHLENAWKGEEAR